MESSIAVFLVRWQACELPPTRSQQRTKPVSDEVNVRNHATNDKEDCRRHGTQHALWQSMRCGHKPRCRSSNQQEARITHYTFYLCMLGCCEDILAEGAIALSVTLSGGALFAS